MDLRQLRALVAVGDHRSFSAAARALHTVQSNVSTHVSRLERELGAVLVDRATMELTEEGALVAARALRVDAELSAISSDVASVRNVVSGTVRLGVIGTTARWLVPRLLDEMARTYPDVRLVILDATTSSLVLNLLGARVDLAIVHAPIDDPELVLDPLFDEDRVVVAPADHPLAATDRIALADLAGHPLLLPAEGTPFRAELDDDAERAGVTLISKAEVDGIRLLASLAFAGFGAAILPASAAPGSISGDWRRVPIHDASRRQVALCWRGRRMPSAADRAVMTEVRRLVEADAPQQAGITPIASGR